jgi:hypothetical protein
VPTFTGGRLVRRPRYVQTPSGRIEQIPGKREGSQPMPECPACELAPEADAEFKATGRGGVDQRRVVSEGRNDPCPFGSGRKAKKCCGAT